MSQVDMQFKANKTKQKLKQMLKNIDQEKNGYVKDDLFYQLLTLHGIDLSQEARTVINSSYKKKDKINYQDALTVIGIDQETAAAQVENWIVRTNGNDNKNETRSNAGSVMSRAKSMASKRSVLGGSLNRNGDSKSKNNDLSLVLNNVKEITYNLKNEVIKEEPIIMERQSQLDLLETQSRAQKNELQRQGSDIQMSKKQELRKFQYLNKHYVATYLKQLLKDRDSAEQVIQVVTQLYKKGVDSRQMAYLKQGFVKQDPSNTGQMKGLEFRKILKTIIKNSSDENETFEIIVNYVKLGESEKDKEVISFEKLNTLIEVYQFYPLINMSKDKVSQYLENLLEFIWTKISEKYVAIAQAFRFFDLQNAVEHMKIKIAASDLQQVFDYLDQNQDGYINYHEFCNLCEEKRRNIDPFDRQEALQQMSKNYQSQKNNILNMTIDQQEQEQLERLSNASQYYQGFKSQKLKNALKLPKHVSQNQSFGIGTLPSDNMNKIMTHEFEKEYVSTVQQRLDLEKEKYQIIKAQKRGQHTKASKIRLEFQQNKKLNNSTIDVKLLASKGKDDENKLPALKLRNTGDDEIMKLIKRNQTQNKDKFVAREIGNNQTEQLPTQSNASQQIITNAVYNYDDVKEQSLQFAKKEDKNDLLSQYFSQKRSMKNKL
ncbi:ef hand family protein [Stylonychia lemnae]|uniref:Ef hand family protein n=1 Tax=Stylonychia lemnae TaxID=5949 RepID=A0A078AVZ1_STYLE|nr:ef hand family protein [Stylonychia lemnae]|eukprot:CDW86344.1 ef hand family protein [Stylonychia lemnae]